MVGNTFYGPVDVVRVLLGETVPGRLVHRRRAAPAARRRWGCSRASRSASPGVTFQTMLRNPLASPDIIGISSGASAAAVFGIVVLSLDETAVSFLALVGRAASTAAAIYLLVEPSRIRRHAAHPDRHRRRRDARQRVTYVLSRAAAWDLQTAMQWLTGSLNGATWEPCCRSPSPASSLVPLLLAAGPRPRRAAASATTAAASLGVPCRPHACRPDPRAPSRCWPSRPPRAGRSRSSRSWPARSPRASSGPGASLLLPAGLVGALLVLVADLVGQFAFDTRYPVGVITGVLGAPYLVYLLIRTNRSGGSL